jgi:hypothetical protein
MKTIIFTEHALFQMKRRDISAEDVKAIIENPEQTEEIRPGRVVVQSRILSGEPPKEFLVRVFVDVSQDIHKVVTVYRTRKFEKYWR